MNPVLLLALAAALAEDTRDGDIFGGTSTPVPVPVPAGDDPLGGVLLTDQGIASALNAADQRVTVGGRFYLRANSTLPESPSLANTVTTSPNLLDLFVDTRPNDRIRAFVQGRLKEDPTIQTGSVDWLGRSQEPTSVLLDQMWLKFDVGRRVFVTAGRQRIKWGAGRFWNPTDFLDPARLDPLAFFDERTGVSLLKLDIPLDHVNVYAVGDLEGASTPEQVGGALRVEALLGLTEVALSSAIRKDEPLRLGGQIGTSLGPFDLKAEAAVLYNDTQRFWKGDLDWNTGVVPTGHSRRNDWIPQVVGAAEWAFKYNDRDSLYVGAEAFFNDAGISDPELYPWLLLQGQFTPFYLGRTYGGAYLYLPGPGSWDDHDFILSTLGNLSDRSYVTRLDWSARLLTQMQVNAFAQYHFGKTGEFHYSLDIPAIPGVMDEAVAVLAPLLDLGIGAQVEF